MEAELKDNTEQVNKIKTLVHHFNKKTETYQQWENASPSEKQEKVQEYER